MKTTMVRRGLVFLFAVFALAMTVFACGGLITKQQGGLVLVITTDLSITDMNTFRVEVSQETSPGVYGEPLLAKDYAMPAESPLPATLTIAAGKAPSQNVLVRAIGRKVEGATNTAVVLREVEVRVPTDRVAALTMILSAACAGQVKIDATGRYVSTCPKPRESCQPTTGQCGSSIVDVDTLPPYDQVKDNDAALPIRPIPDGSAGTVGPSEKSISSFVLAGVTATISGTDIFVSLPPNTNAVGVAPTIVWRGATITPDPSTSQDFTVDGKPVRYTVTALDGSELIYTVHVSVAASDTKRIESFIVPNANTIYDLLGGSEIELRFPFGADITNVTPTVVFVGKSLDPPSGVAQNFTSPVKYTVTAYDGSTRVYTVIADIAAADAAEMTSFKLNGLTGDVGLGTVEVMFPDGVDLTNDLTPEIQYIGASVSPASGVPQNFENPVTYTVTSQDGTVKEEYVVTVKRPPVSAPTFSPESGSYGHALGVVIECRTPGAQLRVTHGAGAPNPTEASPLYAGPIPVNAGSVAYAIKARCFSAKHDPPFFTNGVSHLYSVNGLDFDGPHELSFGPTRCGQTAAPKTFALSNTSDTALTFTIDDPDGDHFAIAPATGAMPANSATGSITVTPKAVPADAKNDVDITQRLDIELSNGFLRTVTLRQKVTCP